MLKTFLQATRIGKYVQESLAETTTGKVVGGTSKGVFFMFGKNSLFLTRSQALSPFNISINENALIPGELQAGDEVFYSVDDLLIPTRQVTIALADAEVWTPPEPQNAMNSPSDQKTRVQAILKHIQAIDANKGFLFLSREPQQLTSPEMRIRDSVKGFTTAYAVQDLNACLMYAEILFGLGTGLTPSGDDLITGYILFMSRLSLLNTKERAFNDELGKELTQLAYQKTTWVSANRLEAVCRGWSEAIFLDAINFIWGISDRNEKRIARTLFEFGHSSGVDTFMGIALATEVRLISKNK